MNKMKFTNKVKQELKKKENKERIKELTLLICFGVWLIDLTSTVLGLNLIEGAYETNPMSAYLFSFGVVGYLMDIIVSYLFLYITIYFIIGIVLVKLYKVLTKKEMPESLYAFLFLLFIFTFCLGEVYAIINNVYFLIF